MKYVVLLLTLLALAWSAPALGAVLRADHELTVRLEPGSHELYGTDRIQLELQDGHSVDLHLGEEAEVLRLLLDGRKAAYDRRAAWILVEVPQELANGQVLLELDYAARYDDPLPEDPVNFDNPGFGVRGVIAEPGALLMAGSGWHPRIAAAAESFDLRVLAPQGMYAVTHGRLEGLRELEDGRSESRWHIADFLEELPLTAGRYLLETKQAPLPGSATVPVQTFFFRDNARLAPRYLEAASRHVGFYSELHGPYAFDKFAVVENFFPTGYGFPSFTLLGGMVLRLPFIPETSLRHEVAHCWWGNGVLVNYAEGNWCEGLCTYVADYLAEEEKSHAAAKSYRLRVLRDYALLVGAEPEMPLRRFVSRTSPQSRAVGYGKAMFVFHMLRQMTGEAEFWNALRTLYADKLFRKASWSDILDVFVRQGGLDASTAGCFFKQWIDWPDAPQLSLEDVRLQRDGAGWRVDGRIRQQQPAFCLHLPLLLETPEGPVEKTLVLDRASRGFSLRSQARPTALQADPDADIFRLLAPQEIPATVNSLKGADSLVAIMAAGQSPERGALLELLLQSLGRADVTVLREEELTPAVVASLNDSELLFFGYPQNPGLQALLPPPPEGLTIAEGRFRLEGAPQGSQPDTLFVALTREPDVAGSVVGLLLARQGAPDAAVARAVRKITHYGSYGCLAFQEGRNLVKRRWPAAQSPLHVTFDQPGSAATAPRADAGKGRS